MTEGNCECWDGVWNPVRGCEPMSDGCRNCTSARLAAHLANVEPRYRTLVRWGASGQPEWTGEISMDPESLCEPLLWNQPRKVLVCSMSDLFHGKVSDGFIADVFQTMWINDRHSFFVVTKNSLRMEQWFGSWAAQVLVERIRMDHGEWPLPNVCMGISAEHQGALDERASHLLTVPAAQRCVLLEPLLAQMDLTNVECPLARGEPCSNCDHDDGVPMSECIDGYYNLLQEGIDWVVVGSETGPRSRTRPMKSEWVRDLRDQCEENQIPFFYKQANDAHGVRVSLPLLDGRQWLETPV